MAEFYVKKPKKVCQLCAGKPVSYKNPEIIRKYISGGDGKVLPRRITGTCARHQREVVKQVKYARHMALVPFTR